MSRRALAAVAAAALTVGCATTPPRVPPNGPVLRHDFMAGHFNYCGKGCLMWVPDHWSVTVQANFNPGWTGEVDVDQEVYDHCDRPKLWPNCWQDAGIQ